MTTITCGTCDYFEAWIIEDDPAESRGLCQVPSDRLPLSMRGTALRERDPVGPLWRDCPVHSALKPFTLVQPPITETDL